MAEMSPPSAMDLTVVVPVLNEAANVAPLCARLKPVLSKITEHWEILFVDDGSIDTTLAQVRDEHERDRRVGAISFSRNFGKEVAIAAGLDHARGRGVVIMDADLQHPPEMIDAMAAKWREGYAMVYGERGARSEEGPVRRGLARVFYRLFRTFGEMPLPEGAGDFRLLDRKAVDALKAMGERARFSKGLYAWIGFPSIGVPFTVAERTHGHSKWSLRKLLHFAFDGITSFSTVPLRVWTYVGLLISLFSIGSAAYFLIRTLLFGTDQAGYPSLIVSIMFFAGIQLMSLGIIGEYVGRVFAEVKRRPLYLVAARIEPEDADPLAQPREERHVRPA